MCRHRWFMDTAEIYNPVVMVQLICNTIMMAITDFCLDMVRVELGKQSASFIHACHTFQLFDHINFEMASIPIAVTLSVSNLLPFWKNDHRKLRKNGRLHIRFELVQTTNRTTKIFHSDDCKYAETTLLPRIRNYQFEFGNICNSEYIQNR